MTKEILREEIDSAIDGITGSSQGEVEQDCITHISDLAEEYATDRVKEHQYLIGSTMQEAIDRAWGIIANAGGGNWENESLEWQEAAKDWRANFERLANLSKEV